MQKECGIDSLFKDDWSSLRISECLVVLSFIMPLFRGYLIYLPILGVLLCTRPRFKISPLDLILTLFLGLYFSLKCWSSGYLIAFQSLRWYFGFLPIFLILKASGIQLSKIVRYILWIFIAATFAEFFGVNFLDMSPNQFATNVFQPHHAARLGDFQRSLGLAGSPSSSSVMISSLLAYCAFYKIRLSIFLWGFAFSSLILSYSGVGFLVTILWLTVFLIDFLFAKVSQKTKLVILFFGFLAFIPIILVFISGHFTKFSLWYLIYIYEFKLSQVSSVILPWLHSWKSVLFGIDYSTLKNAYFGDDFAWKDNFIATGLLGILPIFYLAILKSNKSNIIPLIVMLIGHLHYSTFTNTVGQTVFSLLLLSQVNSISIKDEIAA